MLVQFWTVMCINVNAAGIVIVPKQDKHVKHLKIVI